MIETIYGRGKTPYLTRIKLTPLIFGRRLLLHIFHRPDLDTYHDHPFDFWTMPLNYTYAEDVLNLRGESCVRRVRRWRISYRDWFHTHRILYWHNFTSRKLVTLVWHRTRRKDWGFWVEVRPIEAMLERAAGRDMKGNYRWVSHEEFLR